VGDPRQGARTPVGLAPGVVGTPSHSKFWKSCLYSALQWKLIIGHHEVVNAYSLPSRLLL
jgi:hypothetical protein